MKRKMREEERVTVIVVEEGEEEGVKIERVGRVDRDKGVKREGKGRERR